MITIIVLLILAGVSIETLFRSEGILNKASVSAGKYNEAKARETLETVLMGVATMHKYTNPEYTQDDFLDDIIKEKIENSKVQGDIAIVNGYAYELDRSVPKIGKYLGREEDLVFPDISISTPVLAEDSSLATFTIMAIEDKNGINKIEVLQYGQVVQEFTYSNVTETINQPVTVKRNGKYTVKVYSNLTGTARIELLGITTSVEFSPNGNETYKKVHSTKVTVQENGETVKSLKYQWLSSATEPSEDSFKGAEECTNASTITSSNENMNGQYFLWILLETETGKKNICGSGVFNFDNEGPEIVSFIYNPTVATEFTLECNVKSDVSKIDRYEFYVDKEKIQSITSNENSASLKFESVKGCNTTFEIKVFDKLGNVSSSGLTDNSNAFIFEKYALSTNYKVVETHSGTLYNKEMPKSIPAGTWGISRYYDIEAAKQGKFKIQNANDYEWTPSSCAYTGALVRYISGSTLYHCAIKTYDSSKDEWKGEITMFDLSIIKDDTCGDSLGLENYSSESAKPNGGSDGVNYYKLLGQPKK